jgi:hypothetical protein
LNRVHLIESTEQRRVRWAGSINGRGHTLAGHLVRWYGAQHKVHYRKGCALEGQADDARSMGPHRPRGHDDGDGGDEGGGEEAALIEAAQACFRAAQVCAVIEAPCSPFTSVCGRVGLPRRLNGRR